MRITRRFMMAGLAVFFGTVCGCGFFPEATFQLAPDSRLPMWFAPPPTFTRNQLSVTMSYYIGISGPTAIVTLLGPKGQVIQKLNGPMLGSQPHQLKVQPPGFPPGYPKYEVVSINGITEVVEHRAMQPIFYLADDPNILAELGVRR